MSESNFQMFNLVTPLFWTPEIARYVSKFQTVHDTITIKILSICLSVTEIFDSRWFELGVSIQIYGLYDLLLLNRDPKLNITQNLPHTHVFFLTLFVPDTKSHILARCS